MTNTPSEYLENLKYILENSLHPEQLDSHPWTSSPIMQELEADAQDKSPGQRLVFAINKLFTQMMPSAPPKRGKRLDTRWGEFGILAAQYFAPLTFGASSPDSLRDAWGRIDQAILLFVYGKSHDSLSAAEKETYKLVGDELEVAPNSTLSDWHRKGLQRLADAILARENYLTTSLSKSAVVSQAGPADDPSPASDDKEQNRKIQKPASRRFIAPLLILILLALILSAGFKAWKIYELAMLVRQDAARIQELIAQPTPRLERVKAVGPALSTLRQDFKTLKKETEPFFWMGTWLKWMPVYGGELASIQDLAAVADSLLASADLSYQAVVPLINEDDLENLNPSRLTELLSQAQPQLMDAKQALDQAVSARSRLTPDSLSAQVRDLIINKVDPLISLMQGGLTVALEFPRLMGATGEGPKTYLLLVQNEDELRPTGGFITAAGTLLIQDGRVSSLTFLNSGALDNWEKPYPAAPWQLRQYMNSPVLIFRDANWFTDYRIAALYAEYLYSYTSAHSVDGVIAFDQHMLVQVLGVTGPIQVEDVSYLIDANNVVAYMRAAKTPSAEELASPGWTNKVFINNITRALITKIFSGDVQWAELSTMLLQTLDERHLLIQLDSPTMTSLLERYHWDGAVRPGTGDFLMVVDSNVGFNKTNAVVESSLSYDVDLTKPASPTASLTVFHKNNAPAILFCKHWNKVRAQGEKDYPITDCYWNYLRVYMKEGTKLLDATPQFVPDNWMILKQEKQGRVDVLEEEIDGVQAFGTLQVLLGGESLSVGFQFGLPADILKIASGSDQITYHLKLQKQPGTLAPPITIRVHLPKGALIETLPAEAVVEDNNILYQTNLRTDIEFEVVFSLPKGGMPTLSPVQVQPPPVAPTIPWSQPTSAMPTSLNPAPQPTSAMPTSSNPTPQPTIGLQSLKSEMPANFKQLVEQYYNQGYLPSTKGEYHPLVDFSKDWAQINDYDFWETGYYPENFMLTAHFEWQSAIRNPDPAGCGFVFRKQGNDHYLFFLDREMVWIGTWHDSARKLTRIGPTIGNNRVGLGNPGKADVAFIVNKTKAYAFVNNEFRGDYFLDIDWLLGSGELDYTVVSGTNKDYGTRCSMTNVHLWIIEP